MPLVTQRNEKSDSDFATTEGCGESNPRLGYLISQYPAVSHTFILNEIAQLRKLGFEIKTASINACDRSSSSLPTEEDAERNNTFYVKPSGAVNALKQVLISIFRYPSQVWRGLLFTASLPGSPRRFFYLIEALMIGDWMRKNALDHLHIHFGMAAATVGLIAAKTFGITFSLTIHGPEEFYDVSKFYLAEKVNGARFICCIGSFARSQMMKLSASDQWHKFKVVPLGVDPQKFAPRANTFQLPWRQPEGTFEILCVGRLVPAKGQHILISAVKRLITENRAIRLRMLGDGPERGSLERRIERENLSGHVILEGAVNPDRIPDFIKEAHVFALASFAEGIPVALMEAMSAEVPCVSTVIAGIPELIRDDIDGLLVSPSDEEALASAFRRLMDEPGLRRRLGKAGRLRVMQHYNLEQNVNSLAEVYRCQLR